MKSSFWIDLQRFMLIPTKFPLSPDNYWCTRTLRNKLVYVCVYGVTRLLAAAYTKHNIANSLVKKLLAIQSNKKQYCLKVTSQGFKPWTFRTGI